MIQKEIEIFAIHIKFNIIRVFLYAFHVPYTVNHFKDVKQSRGTIGPQSEGDRSHREGREASTWAVLASSSAASS